MYFMSEKASWLRCECFFLQSVDRDTIVIIQQQQIPVVIDYWME